MLELENTYKLDLVLIEAQFLQYCNRFHEWLRFVV